MSIEEELKISLHKKANAMKVPNHLDVHIHQLYKDHLIEKEGKSMSFTKRFPKLTRAVVFTLVLILLTGFAYTTSQVLFKTNNERVNMQYSTDTNFVFKYTTNEKIRSSLKGVREQLKVAEAAIVYLPDLAKEDHYLFKKFPFMRVTNPYIYTDLELLKEDISTHTTYYKLPSVLPNEYKFIGGKMEDPFGGLVDLRSEAVMEKQENLKERAKESGDEVIWELIEAEYSLYNMFTLMYEGSNQDQINVWISFPDEKVIGIEGITNEETFYEAIIVGEGIEAHYIETDDMYLSQTDHLKKLVWIDELDNKMSIFYEISSESRNVTKEDLILIAQGMK